MNIVNFRIFAAVVGCAPLPLILDPPLKLVLSVTP